nr:hypothetical protein [Tanacetum cinerariifolium]
WGLGDGDGAYGGDEEVELVQQQGHLDLRFASAARAFKYAFNAANKGVWFVVQQPVRVRLVQQP